MTADPTIDRIALPRWRGWRGERPARSTIKLCDRWNPKRIIARTTFVASEPEVRALREELTRRFSESQGIDDASS